MFLEDLFELGRDNFKGVGAAAYLGDAHLAFVGNFALGELIFDEGHDDVVARSEGLLLFESEEEIEKLVQIIRRFDLSTEL